MKDAQAITMSLKGRWHGSYGQARCPAHDDQSPSLSLSDGTDGRLLAFCHAGCDFTAILTAIEHKGISLTPPQRSISKPYPYTLSAAVRNSTYAQRCWEETSPIKGTIAEIYLRKFRGITCPLPHTLRFHPAAWHGNSQQALPALVARVQASQGFAVHRTYLQLDGMGKANVSPPKAMLGSTIGGAVRLSEGTKALAVTEGIETGLSLLCGPLQGEVAVWAALSATGMQKLILPSQATNLIIANDGDLTGQTAAQRLAERAHNLGWTVTLFPAPEGRDWNDVIQNMKGAM